MVNSGRIFTESELNMTDTRSIFDINTSEEAYNSIVTLVNQSYNLIVSSSLTHGDAVYRAAKEFPQVKFVTRGRGNSSISNIARISYSVQSADYMAGYFAGMVTETGIVGIVVPGVSDQCCKGAPTYHQANSFAVGAYNAAKFLGKEITVYCMDTDSYFDVDLGKLAANTILSRGADILSQIQDDMTVSIVSMDQGHLSIGTTGFPQRDVYGEKVGTSYIVDWGILFIEACNRFINNNWTLGWSYLGDFNNHVLSLDRFSYKVTDPYAQYVRDEEARFKNGSGTYTPQYCYPPSCQQFNCTNGCVPYSQWVSSKQLLSSIRYLGVAVIPLTESKISTPVVITFIILSIFFILLCLLAIVAVIYYRNSKSIRSASPIFCIAILIGGIMVFISVIMWVVSPTNSICRVRYWLVSLGYTILLGNMVVKNFRIYLLFNNKQLKVLKITNSKLFPYVAGAVLVNIILLLLFTLIGNLDTVQRRNIDDIGKYEYIAECHTNSGGDVILYILLGFYGVMILIGCFVSFKIRTVDIDEFNESKSIASILYAITFCLFIIVPLFISNSKIHDRLIILAASFTFTTASGLLILFVPKFYKIYKFGPQRNALTPMSNNIETLSNFDDEESEGSQHENPTDLKISMQPNSSNINSNSNTNTSISNLNSPRSIDQNPSSLNTTPTTSSPSNLSPSINSASPDINNNNNNNPPRLPPNYTATFTSDSESEHEGDVDRRL
eukprot:gene10108-12397_t